MKKLLAFLLSAPAVFAQGSLTPMQTVWSVFAAAVILVLFILYHLHLEGRRRKKK